MPSRVIRRLLLTLALAGASLLAGGCGMVHGSAEAGSGRPASFGLRTSVPLGK